MPPFSCGCYRANRLAPMLRDSNVADRGQRQRHGWHGPVSGQCPYGWPALRHAVDERKPKRWRRNAARRSGIAIRLNRANGTYSAA